MDPRRCPYKPFVNRICRASPLTSLLLLLGTSVRKGCSLLGKAWAQEWLIPWMELAVWLLSSSLSAIEIPAWGCIPPMGKAQAVAEEFMVSFNASHNGLKAWCQWLAFLCPERAPLFQAGRDALSPHVSQSPRFSVPTFPHVWTDDVTDYIWIFVRKNVTSTEFMLMNL